MGKQYAPVPQVAVITQLMPGSNRRSLAEWPSSFLYPYTAGGLTGLLRGVCASQG
jgi:hypothetical protein